MRLHLGTIRFRSKRYKSSDRPSNTAVANSPSKPCVYLTRQIISSLYNFKCIFRFLYFAYSIYLFSWIAVGCCCWVLGVCCLVFGCFVMYVPQDRRCRIFRSERNKNNKSRILKFEYRDSVFLSDQPSLHTRKHRISVPAFSGIFFLKRYVEV